ncbi:MAG: HTH-type transcriptional regulator CysB [Steroidobacteraceae bacterium]|jgi:LysR family cys regulon transcriptional activator|nr:HTH-type transcriptional regulator CysB [Steroidobacteraceae bacterium]
MKLHQLRYLAAVVQNGMNITAASKKLHTSQPGVSKQLKLLEDELGFPIFERDGRNLVSVTPAGQEVVDRALRILEEVSNIRRLSSDLKDDRTGSLSIGTTHTQARYVLPEVVQKFRAAYPEIDLHLHQGTSEQIADLAKLDRIDFAIATGSGELFPGLVLLPCYRWSRRIVVPRGHPLAQEREIRLSTLARFPLVTYTFSFTGRSSLPALFEAAGLKLNVALTASDADVIKTYVRLGLGVGIVASMAFDPRDDADLVVLPADHLFTPHVTWIGFRRGRRLRGYMYEFLKAFAPHLTRRLVDQGIRAGTPEELAQVVGDLQLPER